MKHFILIACMLIGTAVSAQKTNYAGSWKLVDYESISGQLYANATPKKISIKQSDAQMEFERVSMGANGDVTATDVIPTDKIFETVNPTSKRKRTVKVTWAENGKAFTAVTHIYNDSEGKTLFHLVTDNYSIEGDQLILNRKDENKENGEVWEVRAIYERG